MAEHEFDYLEAGRALRRFFQSNGIPDPEDAAQEAIARLLEKAREKTFDDPWAYLKGIAKNMVKESFKHRKPDILPIIPASERINERLFVCLERCEKQLLESDERKLLRDWYRGEGREKILQRRHLAVREASTLDNLKAKVHRLRQKIAPCVRKCRAVEDA